MRGAGHNVNAHFKRKLFDKYGYVRGVLYLSMTLTEAKAKCELGGRTAHGDFETETRPDKTLVGLLRKLGKRYILPFKDALSPCILVERFVWTLERIS